MFYVYSVTGAPDIGGTSGELMPERPCIVHINLGTPVNLACSTAFDLYDGTFDGFGCGWTGAFEYEQLCTGCCVWFALHLCEPTQEDLTLSGSGTVRMISPNGNTVTGVLPYTVVSDFLPGLYMFEVCPTSSTGLIGGFGIFGNELCSTTLSTSVPCGYPCNACLPDFGPEPGNYILNAWASEYDVAGDVVNFTSPHVRLTAFDVNNVALGTFDGYTSGAIIDGWQRIEIPFSVPPGTVNLQVELLAQAADVYYDDIRVFPADGSMKCYVYDPVNLRFVAELDERHYATFYEYDGEGKLARVKKETERGIMTIQETRYNSSKISGQ